MNCFYFFTLVTNIFKLSFSSSWKSSELEEYHGNSNLISCHSVTLLERCGDAAEPFSQILQTGMTQSPGNSLVLIGN